MNWRDISSAPKDGSAVLGWCVWTRTESAEARVVRYARTRDGWISAPGAYDCRPTHWMPLPDPPQPSDPLVAHTEQLLAAEENEI